MKLIAASLLTIFIIGGCKKNDIGGKSTINGTVVHHATAIPYARVFIKFNAQEFPGNDTTFYDNKISADASGKFEIKVYKGNYYLYSVGIDNTSAKPDVRGGVPVKVRHKEVVEVTVPVTDQH